MKLNGFKFVHITVAVVLQVLILCLLLLPLSWFRSLLELKLNWYNNKQNKQPSWCTPRTFGTEFCSKPSIALLHFPTPS